jgi:hypothetical protein
VNGKRPARRRSGAIGVSPDAIFAPTSIAQIRAAAFHTDTGNLDNRVRLAPVLNL